MASFDSCKYPYLVRKVLVVGFFGSYILLLFPVTVDELTTFPVGAVSSSNREDGVR